MKKIHATGEDMKYLIKLYRFWKPVAVYTSYLFTALTVLYLLVRTASAELLPDGTGFQWGIFFFSFGSILMQKVLLGNPYLEGIPYGLLLLLYMGAAGGLGYVCLHVSIKTAEGAGSRMFFIILLTGIGVCAGFELFNRYRAHMYNRLLDQYQKRRRRA